MATHSSILAWRIPGMGEPGGLPSMGLHRVGHDWRDLAVAVIQHPKGSLDTHNTHTHTHTHRKIPWEDPGTHWEKMVTESWSYKSRNAEDGWTLPAAGREAQNRCPLQPSRRSQPCWCLDFGPFASRTVKEYISIVVSHPSCGHLLWQP